MHYVLKIILPLPYSQLAVASTHFVRTGDTVLVACSSEPFLNAHSWKPS